MIKDCIFDQFLINTPQDHTFATIKKYPLDTFEDRLKTAIREEVEERIDSLKIYQNKYGLLKVGYTTSFNEDFECELIPIPLY
jgi:hypothetical protein